MISLNRIFTRFRRFWRGRLSLPALLERSAGGLVCPLYHIVRDDVPRWWGSRYLFRDRQSFTREIDELLSLTNPVSVEDLLAWRQGQASRPKGFLLSFDDGYREMADVIAPILKAKGVPAIFFLASSLLDNKQPFFEDVMGLIEEQIQRNPQEGEKLLRQQGVTMAQLWEGRNPYHPAIPALREAFGIDAQGWVRDEQPYLSSAQVRKLLADGFTIGAHSIDHPLYAGIDRAEQERQTRESMGQLVKQFGLRNRLFAFPYGEIGVDRSFCIDLVRDGVVEMFFGTGGTTRDKREPHVLQRLWCEDHSRPLMEMIRAELLKRRG